MMIFIVFIGVFFYFYMPVMAADKDYIIVSDGWSTGYPRYINITDIDFINTYGVNYNIA